MVKSISRERLERQVTERLKESIAETNTFSEIAKTVIDIAAKYVLTDADVNLPYKQAAEERLGLMLEYCCLNEQPVAAYILIRILKQSETDKDLMSTLQYDYSDEFQHSVNLILFTILNFYNEIGGGDE